MKHPSPPKPARSAKLQALLAPSDAIATTLVTNALAAIKKPPGMGE